MNDFLQIQQLIIPKKNIETVYDHLRNVGKQGVEGIALLLGYFDKHQFIVSTTIIPEQKAYKTESGLLYYVEGDELHQINVWAYKNKQFLVAQIHSHPGSAYHSQMDDDFPIVTSIGAFSIVIPDFAFGPLDISLWAVYRLLPETGWTYINTEKLTDLIKIS